ENAENATGIGATLCWWSARGVKDQHMGLFYTNLTVYRPSLRALLTAAASPADGIHRAHGPGTYGRLRQGHRGAGQCGHRAVGAGGDRGALVFGPCRSSARRRCPVSVAVPEGSSPRPLRLV